MNKKLLAGFATAGLLLLASVVPAQAIPITYTLQDVTFTDGATATGSFVFDASARAGTVISILTTSGVLPAFTFSDANSGLYVGGGAGLNNFIIMTDDGRRLINFSFATALTDAGGTFALGPSVYECNNCGTFRRVSAGVITSVVPAVVPEPGTIALLLPSLGLLGFAVRRRKGAAA